MPNHDKIIIGVDFDGTLCDHKYPRIGDEVPGAIGWLKRFQKEGALLILWTMRSARPNQTPGPLAEAVAWCGKRGVTFWGVNSNPEQHEWTQSPKQYAHIYIDDAAIGCPLNLTGYDRPVVDWTKVGPMVLDRMRELRQR